MRMVIGFIAGLAAGSFWFGYAFTDPLTVRTPVELLIAGTADSTGESCWVTEVSNGRQRIAVMHGIGVHAASSYGGVRTYRFTERGNRLQRGEATAALRDALNDQGDEILREGSRVLDACSAEYLHVQARDTPHMQATAAP